MFKIQEISQENLDICIFCETRRYVHTGPIGLAGHSWPGLGPAAHNLSRVWAPARRAPPGPGLCFVGEAFQAHALFESSSRPVSYRRGGRSCLTDEGVTAKRFKLLNSGLPATTCYYGLMALTPHPAVGVPVLSLQQAEFLEEGGLLGPVWGPLPLDLLRVQIGRAGSLGLLSSPMCSWHITQRLARSDFSNDLLNR